ncbi:MAG: hypothetical protein IPN76_03770 [Saprospiraceae bacterium]|nr:hypothetical protein [Saprospiraceae bacterium]
MKNHIDQVKKRVGAVIAIAAIVLLQAGAQGQKAIVHFNPQSGLVDVNGVTMDGVATFDVFKEKLGLPSNKIDSRNGETALFFEELGIVFYVQENIVKGLGITFNTDGDKKFPATSLHGTLTIGEVEITKESTQDVFRSLTAPRFTCPFELMCASENREAATKALVGFKDGVVTQVSFWVKNEQ